MSTWTNITNAAVAVGGIPSSSTVTALRDNPAALAEGASGAPVNQAAWHPYNKVVVGDSYDGLFYDQAVNGSAATVDTPDFENGYEYKVIFSQLSHSNGANNDLICNTITASTGAEAGLFTFTVAFNDKASGEIKYTNARVIRNKKTAYGAASTEATGTIYEYIKIQAYSSVPARARFKYNFGNITGGKMWLYRRRDYSVA